MRTLVCTCGCSITVRCWLCRRFLNFSPTTEFRDHSHYVCLCVYSGRLRRNRKPLDHLLIFISIVAIWMWAHTKIQAHVDDVPILRSTVPPVLRQCKCDSHNVPRLPNCPNWKIEHEWKIQFLWMNAPFDSLISTHCTSDYDRKIESHWENWCACHRRLMVMTTKTALSSCQLVYAPSLGVWCRRHSRTMYFNSVA